MLFRKLFDLVKRGPTRRRSPAPRPRLERLDDRCLPSFVGPVTYPADAIPPGPAAPIQDFNRGGYADYASGTTIRLGNGDGTYRTGQSLPASGYYWNGTAAGDFNGDGLLDVAITSTTPTTSTTRRTTWTCGSAGATAPSRFGTLSNSAANRCSGRSWWST